MPPSKSKLFLSNKKDDHRLLAEMIGKVEDHPKVVDALRTTLKTIDEVFECLSKDECWTQLSTELTGLIVTSLKKLQCPPYESIYVIREGPRVFDAPSVASSLKRYYSLLGLEVNKDTVLGSDHVTVELEFLAALHDAEAFALEGLLQGVNPEDVAEIRRGFLEDHLAKWVFEFLSCLKGKTEVELVKGIAESIESLLNVEKYV